MGTPCDCKLSMAVINRILAAFSAQPNPEQNINIGLAAKKAKVSSGDVLTVLNHVVEEHDPPDTAS
jgi:hypothetical protein